MDSLQENRNDVLLKVEDLSNLILNSTFAKDLIKRLDFLVIDKIKQLLYDNILKFV